jgi:hypothetical protein
VSKSPRHPEDWSSDSEALFQSARADHDPTAADRARVRRELARRVAEASVAAPIGGDVASALTLKSSQSVVVANLVKLSIGVACVLAAVFAVIRLGGSAERPREQPLVAQTQQTTTATPAARAIESAPAEPTASRSVALGQQSARAYRIESGSRAFQACQDFGDGQRIQARAFACGSEPESR